MHNYCIDFIKGIACICVVFMHCEFPGKLGVLIQCVSRFCVPFFFMVSGYFCYYDGGSDPLRKIVHIGKITVLASAFYMLIAVIQQLRGEVLSLSVQGIFYFIVFNQPIVIAGQLWFLFALLYDYVLYAFVEKLNLYKIAHRAIPILIVLYICLAQALHVIGIWVPNMIYRNFLIEGFPLFVLGNWIHQNVGKIKINNRALIVIIVVTTSLCPLERFILGRDFGVNICSYPQVMAMFLYSVKNPALYEKNILRVLGTRYSMLVYILHPFVWHAMEFLYKRISISANKAALYMMPILVAGVAVLSAVLCTQIGGTISMKMKSKTR